MSEYLSNRIQELEQALVVAKYWAEHAPHHYRDVPVPEFLRSIWERPEALYWRMGVDSTMEYAKAKDVVK